MHGAHRRTLASPQTRRPSRVKPQPRVVVVVVVLTRTRARRITNTELLLVSMMTQPQISHLFQKPDDPPLHAPPTSHPDSPPQDRTVSSQIVSPTFKFNFLSGRTQQVTLSLSQTVVLCEVCRNAAPPKSRQLPQKQ